MKSLIKLLKILTKFRKECQKIKPYLNKPKDSTNGVWKKIKSKIL